MREIRKYQTGLKRKNREFVNKLAEFGISVAQAHAGDEYGPYIIFDKTLEPTQANGNVRGVMVATNTGLIRSEWYTINNASGIESADVSPILMAEFGAGIAHDNNPDAHQFGMGAGTFPGQTHAMDPTGWWYIPVNNPDGSPNTERQWYHSTGVEPTMPMATAFSQMFAEIATIAKGVFG